MAARISRSWLSSDFWKASAAPWKCVMIDRGISISRWAATMASTACPSEAPGARLNETVVAGNWLNRSSRSGAVCSSKLAIADSGTCLPACELGR